MADSRGNEDTAGVRRSYRDSLRTAVGSSSAPYGYTLTTWTTGAILLNTEGIPGTLEVGSFMVGAVLGFAFVGALAFGGLRKHFVGEPNRIALWGSLHFFSVGLAMVSAVAVTGCTGGFFAWPLASFLATASYLFVLGAQIVVATNGSTKAG